MRPLRLRLEDAAAERGVALPVIEKDYAISYVLAGLVADPTLT